MDYSSVKVLFFATAALFLFSIDQALAGQCNPPCNGGPHDLCLKCGTYCTKTCAQPNGPDACIAACKKDACQCAPGFVRGPDGMCIRPWQCPFRNETIFIDPIITCSRICYGGLQDKCKLCGSRCPATCEHPGPRACTKDCAVNVCECNQGFVRGPNGQCIRPHQCPNRRPPLCYSRRR